MKTIVTILVLLPDVQDVPRRAGYTRAAGYDWRAASKDLQSFAFSLRIFNPPYQIHQSF